MKPVSCPPPAEMIGKFTPWNAARTGRRSANVGWITDANGCDIWQAGRSPGGYALVWDHGGMRRVHRLRYEREVGPIPDGADLDHFECDNGAGGCCNPHHCRPATPRENVLRGDTISSLNAAKTHCPKGHLLSGANLVKNDVARGERRCRTCTNDRQRARRTKATA